ncbi:universal stress protein [Ralstonia pickettii]|uniref:universal stress protein n=1 Tax=Ralstonia pickettii TaxID=329 RepID=UPI000818A8A8|nr:universal stress protein [Ralstonia pickettii]OCS51306.1 hypothetical protein BEK68_24020 [Ralstonia pickettii]
MYTKIMVAIDASDTSERAFSEAVGLARVMGARLHLVYVANCAPVIAMGVTAVLPDEFEGIRAEGKALLAGTQEKGVAAGVDCETELSELLDSTDDIAGRLLSCASQCGAELAVLGTHGRTGLSRALLGSVAENFVRRSHLPVLLVPAQVLPEPIA